MNTTYSKTKKSTSIRKKTTSVNQTLLLDKDILRAVQIQDSMREKYNAGKNWNAVDIVRKIREKK